MTTHVSTQVSNTHPVRDDLTDPSASTAPAPAVRRHRGWALAGLGAAVVGIVGTGGGIGVSAVYDEQIGADAPAIVERLAEQTAQILTFHVGVTLSAVLLVVFGLGLHRRLRATLPGDSLVPALAGAGLVGTAVVLVLATALDTEFVFGVTTEGLLVPEAAAVYNHWVGTVAGCWILAGLSGLAVFHGSRRGDVPRWLGLVGLVLGGLTVLVGISPMQYMAGLTGLVWLLVTAVGFTAGDRAHRRA